MSRHLAIFGFFGTFAAFIAVAIAAAVSGSGGTGAIAKPLKSGSITYSGTVLQEGTNSAPKVAVVKIVGEIQSGSSDPNGAFVGGEDLVNVIRSIRESEDFEGIILEVDTPGGGVLPSAEVSHELELAKKDGIKIVSWMRDIAASGGYYISAPADHIVAAPSTWTGSIGVIAQFFTVEKLAKDIGIKAETIKSGKMKDIGSPFKALTAEERALLQEMIDEAYADFVKVVAKGRDMSEEDVRTIADGRIYTGRQALDNGLVDELGIREDAYRAMAKLLDESDAQNLQIAEYNRSFSFFDSLGAFGTAPSLDANSLLGLLKGSAPMASTDRSAKTFSNYSSGVPLGDGF